MKAVIFVVCVFSLGNCLKHVEPNGEERIINGVDAERYEFPYHVSIRDDKVGNICSGAILSSKWVITTVLCGYIVKQYYTDAVVVAGILKVNESTDETQIKNIKNFTFHQATKPYRISDLMLLELDSELTWTDAVQPVNLPKPNSEFPGFGLVSGWGLVNITYIYQNDSDEVVVTNADTLQKKWLHIWDKSECEKLLYESDRPAHLCVGDSRHTISQSVTYGDEGSPIVQKDETGTTLIGLFDYASGFLGDMNPKLFVKLDFGLDWINKYITQ